MKKAQYFVTCRELPVHTINEVTPEQVRRMLIEPKKRRMLYDRQQLSISFPDEMS
jgi:hypothetical protein